MPAPEEELARRLQAGDESLLVTVVAVDGRPPSRAGAKLLTTGTAPVAGTLGCSEFDSAALADAPGVLTAGTPVVRTYRHDLGAIQAYLEPYAAAPELVVFAATPVAEQLLRWAPEVGFRTTLVETRPERAALARAAGAGRVIDSLDALAASMTHEAYVVHTDHDAPDLVTAMETVFARSPRFVGLMGSKRHTGHHLEALRARGLDGDRLARLQTPVGVDIGAEGAAEIALSILAGLVAARRGSGPGARAETR